MKEKKKAVGKEEDPKEVPTEKKKNLKIGEERVGEKIGRRTKEGLDGDVKILKKVQLKEKMIKTNIQLEEDGETAKNEKWTNGDHQGKKMIEMVTNVGKEIVI